MRKTVFWVAALLGSSLAMADTVYLVDSAHPSGQSQAPKNTVVAASQAPVAKRLPAAQAAWLQQHFTSPLASYKTDRDDRGVVVYETELRDGTEVDVDAKSVWRKVERRQGVAANLLPQAAQQYLKQHYPQARITQMERDDGKGHIEVDLSQGTEIKFDAAGQVLKVK